MVNCRQRALSDIVIFPVQRDGGGDGEPCSVLRALPDFLCYFVSRATYCAIRTSWLQWLVKLHLIRVIYKSAVCKRTRGTVYWTVAL